MPAPQPLPQSDAGDLPAPPAEAFRRLVEGVTEYAIFMLTPEGDIASWNAGAQRLKGYTPAEALGRHFSMFYPDEARERGWPEEELRLALAHGRLEDEGWRLRKDGSRFWANVVITPIRGDQGELLGYTKVTRDLTERRAQEERLRESERSLRLLIEGVQDYAIFRLDPGGVITSWNLGAQRIKGYSTQEILGRHFSVFYPPDAVAAGWPQEELRRAASQGRFEDEGWRVRKDGSLLWANVIITAIRGEEGELLGFSKVTRDLTERRRHEQMLKESEESLRLLVEGVRDHAMFLLDEDGRVASWNLGAERLLGYRVNEVVGRPAAVLYTAEDEAAGRVGAELQAARHAGFFETDGWRLKSDGTRLWTHTAMTALHDRQGQLRAFALIVRDLSDRLLMQELQDEGRRIHQFIAMLSHELRNPLAPILNAVRILQQTGREPEVSWCADLIGRQASHLARLVDDLLDVSRVTNGKIQMQADTVELNTLVRLAAEAQRPGIEAQGHQLQMKLAPQSLFVSGDATRLTQVVNNLLSNAAKYTPPGGHITLSLERNRSVATLRVTDDGVGMSEPLMQRVFDPFVQGHRTLDRAGGGLGIGLTLVRRVVEMHGGTVTVSSAGEGRGSQFTVTLPLATSAPAEASGSRPAAAALPEQPALARAGRRRVLVVDDNLDAAESLCLLLRSAGHEVSAAHEGPAALQMAREFRPDIVLLDLGLPGMTGYEVAEQLRSQPETAQARLVAITGYGQPSDRADTRAAGFTGHLVKPVKYEDLAAQLG